MYVDAGDVREPFGLWPLFYFLTGLGHQAVVVFFVLSGYLVGGAVMSAKRRFEWRSYAQARLSRLWTVLLPSLALTFMVDQLVWRLAPSLFLGDAARSWHSGPAVGQYDASWSTLLGNLVFLQTIAVPVFGSNGPLWSLANEFWYYALFPMVWLALTGRVRIMMVPGLALFLLMPVEMRWGFLVWLMGVGVHWVLRRSLHTAHVLLDGSAICLACAALILSKWGVTHGLPAPFLDCALGLGIALLLWRFLPRPSPFETSPHLRRSIEHLSDISFSLYLTHFPVLMLIGVLGQFARSRLQISLPNGFLYGALLLLMLALGHTVWYLFERHTGIVRQWMASTRISWRFSVR
jgi:peptidoglycan/LPS O-acetylase OafA/YrhL